MKKIINTSIFIISFLLSYAFDFCFAASENITLTTYYPAPYGVYNQMVTKTLGVGDNNGSSGLDSGDAPDPSTNPGDAWIAGNVGIGTTNPKVRLHVKSGNIPIPSLSSDTGFVLQGDQQTELSILASDNAVINFGDNSDESIAGIGYDYLYNTMTVWTKTAQTSGDIFLNGHAIVGRGVLDFPRNTLDVEGSMAVGANYSGSQSAPANGMIVEGNVGIGTINPQSKTHIVRGTAITSFRVDDAANDSSPFLIDSVGNVGIGTINPLVKLDVVGNVAVSGDLKVSNNTWGDTPITITCITPGYGAGDWDCNCPNGYFVGGIRTTRYDDHDRDWVSRLYCKKL